MSADHDFGRKERMIGRHIEGGLGGQGKASGRDAEGGVGLGVSPFND